jgi:hypothetical protein
MDITTARRTELFTTTGMAYAMEHATRPSTIGLALSSSPLALLSWFVHLRLALPGVPWVNHTDSARIGEKFLDWSDPRQPPSLDTILGMVSLYWFTSCFPQSIGPIVISSIQVPSSPCRKQSRLGIHASLTKFRLYPSPWQRHPQRTWCSLPNMTTYVVSYRLDSQSNIVGRAVISQPLSNLTCYLQV